MAAIPLPLLFCTSALIQNKEENNGQALNGITTAEGSAVGSHGQFGEARQRDTINIASLNAKNVKTNINFIKYLSESVHVIFLQETWLYRFQVNVVTAIFENTEFSCGCVDDDAPLAPSLHMREYGGTCILWHCSLNPMIRKLPETNSRIKAVELKCQTVLLCLVNVYLPARGTSANEMLLAECLDELHEIFVKYSLSHTLVVGGDFNASSHRGEGIRRDVLFLKFVHER